MLERLRLLGADDEAIARRFAYVAPDEPLDEARRRRPLGRQGRACRLAVSATASTRCWSCTGSTERSGRDVERFYRLLDPIRKRRRRARPHRQRCEVDARRVATWAIGSERKKSKAEVHLGMRGIEPLVRGGHRARLGIEVFKDRPGPSGAAERRGCSSIVSDDDALYVADRAGSTAEDRAGRVPADCAAWRRSAATSSCGASRVAKPDREGRPRQGSLHAAGDRLPGPRGPCDRVRRRSGRRSWGSSGLSEEEAGGVTEPLLTGEPGPRTRCSASWLLRKSSVASQRSGTSARR